MARVFNGEQFLKENAVEIKLSNGKSFTVTEIMPSTMEKVGEMEKAEDQDANTVKKILAEICSVPMETFDEIGIVETKGAVDFLLENLFDMKQPS